MNQYVFVLNKQGERITSFVDNLISKDELLEQAKKEWPDAADYIYSAQRRLLLMGKPTVAISAQYIKLNTEMVTRIKEVQ